MFAESIQLNIFLIQLAGLIVLAVLSYQDLKTMTVDTRLNFLMFGMIAGLTIQINYVVFFVTSAGMLVLYLWATTMRRFVAIGEADPEVLAWVFGTIFISLNMLQGCIFFISLNVLLIALAVKYRNRRIPFVPIIALSYFVSFVYFILTL
ncbi:hypothetical protein [Geoglobus ahangari]